MFEQNALINKAVEDVLSATATYQRGDTISMESLEKWARMRRYRGDWNHFIVRLKRAFQDTRGITLWCKKQTAGYKLLSVDEQINYEPMKRRRKAMKQLRLSKRSLNALPVGEMDDTQRILHQFATRHQQTGLDNLRRLEKLASQAIDIPRVPVAIPPELLEPVGATTA